MLDFKSFKGKRFKSVFWRWLESSNGGKVYVKDYGICQKMYLYFLSLNVSFFFNTILECLYLVLLKCKYIC